MRKFQAALLSTLAALSISASEYISPLSDYLSSRISKPTLNYPLYKDLRADRQARELQKALENEQRIRSQMRDIDCLTESKYTQIIRDFEEETDKILARNALRKKE